MDNSGTNDPYETVLADLRAKRAQLDEAIKTLEGLRGVVAHGRPAAPPAQTAATAAKVVATPPRAFGGGEPEHSPYLGMSIADAAKVLLQSKRRQMKTGDIVAAIEAGGLILTSGDKNNTVGSILLRRFYTVGDIVRVSRGVWGLQEWYPGRKFPGAKSKSEDPKGEPETEAVSSSENEADTQSYIEPNNDSALDEHGFGSDDNEPSW